MGVVIDVPRGDAPGVGTLLTAGPLLQTLPKECVTMVIELVLRELTSAVSVPGLCEPVAESGR